MTINARISREGGAKLKPSRKAINRHAKRRAESMARAGFGNVNAGPKHEFAEANGTVTIDGKPISEIANPSCRSCYGTGLIGTRQNPDGSKTRLVCPCVPKRAG